MPVKRYESLARQIEERLNADPTYELPPLACLAKQESVAYVTAHRAVHLLALHGKLVVRQGARARRVSSPTPLESAAVTKLRARIKSDIVDGRYLAGEPLPKFDYYMVNQRVSRATIATAFARLASENLICKRGRQWIAGPAASPREASSHLTRSPVLIMALRNEYDWHVAFTNAHTWPFLASIRTEAAKHGVQLAMILMQEGAPAGAIIPVTVGQNATRRFIQSLGDRYLGAILVDTKPDPDSFAGWVRELSSPDHKPVVFFDSIDIGERFSRTALGLDQYYHRYRLDERAAATMALAALHEAGHRVVGFPTFGEEISTWVLRRLELLREVGGKHSPAMKVLTTHLSEPFWEILKPTDDPYGVANFTLSIEEFTSACRQQLGRSARVRSTMRDVVRYTRSMRSLLDQGMTALVAMNDWAASMQYRWCRSAGIMVPRDLSMVSFDNHPESEFLPITTIDFGFSRLGYHAAHAIMGDLPVPADREGDIAGQCMFINRGSVASPMAGAQRFATDRRS